MAIKYQPRIYYQNDSSDWRVHVEELNKLRAHYLENSSIMSEYDKKIFEEQFSSRMSEVEPMIKQGAIGEFDEAVKAYKKADAGFDRALIAEIARWDLTQMNGAMGAVKQMVDGLLSQGVHVDDLPGKLNALLTEAKQSGDLHKLRATCEVLSSVKGRGSDLNEGMQLNRIADTAKQELMDLRYTDGMKAAEEKQHQASDVLQASYRWLDRAYRALRNQDPKPYHPVDELEKTMARIDTDRQTKKTTVYDSYDEAWRAERNG